MEFRRFDSIWAKYFEASYLHIEAPPEVLPVEGHALSDEPGEDSKGEP